MSKTTRSKIQLCLISFGVIIGMVGILHGIPEILQGSNLVESNSVTALPENWPNSELFTVLNGQPAFSILTGIPFSLLGLTSLLVLIMVLFHHTVGFLDGVVNVPCEAAHLWCLVPVVPQCILWDANKR